MIQNKWRANSENSENSALHTIIVSHKIYEKKYFFIGLTLLLRIDQLNIVTLGGPRLNLPANNLSGLIDLNYFDL